MAALGPPPLAMADHLSVTVLDRNDALLRAFTTAEGYWRLPVEAKDVDPRYFAFLLAFEDQSDQFHDAPHEGVVHPTHRTPRIH